MKAPDISPQAVTTAFRSWTKEDVQQILSTSGNAVYYASVVATDAIYVPEGHVFTELNGTTSNLGLKIGVVTTGDVLFSLQFCANLLQQRGKPNAQLDSLIAASPSSE